MVKEGLFEELNGLFSALLESKGFELVELVHQFNGPRIILTVLADRLPTEASRPGITLAECAWLCKELKGLLEEKNIIDSDYVLEVASPGLDRPLKSAKDFARAFGREAVFFLNEAAAGKIQWQGVITKVQEGSVFIQTEEEVIGIPLTTINKAKLVI